MWGAIYTKLQDHPIITGWLGSTATLSAAKVSTLEHLDLMFRVGASGLGVLAGMLTVLITWNKYQDSRRKRLEREDA